MRSSLNTEIDEKRWWNVKAQCQVKNQVEWHRQIFPEHDKGKKLFFSQLWLQVKWLKGIEKVTLFNLIKPFFLLTDKSNGSVGKD